MKRSFAFLMAMLLALSCFAMAAGASPAAGRDPGHVHSYTTVIDPGRPATCTEGGGDYCQCSCGEVGYVPTGPLGHAWSSPEEITTDSGIMLQQYCYRCGAYNVTPAAQTGPTTRDLPDGFDSRPDDQTGLAITAVVADPRAYQMDEACEVLVSVTNIGKVPVGDIQLWSNNFFSHFFDHVNDGERLEPGQTVIHTWKVLPYMYNVTDGKLTDGCFAFGTTPEGMRVYTDVAMFTIDVIEQETADRAKLILTVTPNAPKSEYESGSSVECTWTVTNVGGKDTVLNRVGAYGEHASHILPVTVPVPAGGSASGTINVPMPVNVGNYAMKATFIFAAEAGTAEEYCSSNEFTKIFPVAPMGGLEDWQEPVSYERADIEFSKQVVNSPADPAGFHEGEMIRYLVRVTSHDPQTLYVNIMDPMIRPGLIYPAKLENGMSTEAVFEYIVTAADVANGMVINTAYASFYEGDGTQRGDFAAEAAVLTSGEHTPQAALRVYLKEIGSSQNSGGYMVGETVRYCAAVSNDGECTLTDVHMTDRFGNVILDGAALEPGKTLSVSYQLAASEEDALNGWQLNRAEATGWCEELQSHVSGISGWVSVPAYIPEDGLSVTMRAVSTPAAGSYYTLGETVVYEITLHNCGTESVLEGNAGYQKGGVPQADGSVPFGQIAPGEELSVCMTHEVNEADIAMGFIETMAMAGYRNSRYDACFSWGNTVRLLTDPDADVLLVRMEEVSHSGSEPICVTGDEIVYQILAANPMGHEISGITVQVCMNDGEWTVLESGLTLDAYESRAYTFTYTVTHEDSLHAQVTGYALAQTDAAVYVSAPVQTAVGAAVVSEQTIPTLSNDPVQVPPSKDVRPELIPNEAAGIVGKLDPDRGIAWNAASEAVTIDAAKKPWEELIDRRLNTIFEAVGRRGDLVLQEKARFGALVDARETLLRASGMREEAAAGELNRLYCIYSSELSSGTVRVQGEPAESCALTVTDAGEDGFIIERSLCDGYADTEQALSQLDDSLRSAVIRLRVRRAVLNSVTDELYLAADETLRPAIASDRRAFDAWTDSHIAYLQLFYGEDAPEPYDLTGEAILDRIAELKK